MEVTRGQSVLLDTNAIIETFRVGAWKVLAGAYRLRTAETCCGEAGWGNPGQPGYVPVDVTLLCTSATIVEVQNTERAALDLRIDDPAALDPGERDLLAYLLAFPNAYAVCSPDKACIRAGHTLGLLDRFVALEELFSKAGVHPSLKQNYTTSWLSNFRTGLLLEGGL